MGKEKSKIMCPNCGAEAVRMEKDGAVLVCCEKEDAVFALTKTGAKLRKVGAIDDLERRVRALEGKTDTPAEAPAGDPGDAGVPDEAPADEDEDEDDDGGTLEVTIDDEDEE